MKDFSCEFYFAGAACSGPCGELGPEPGPSLTVSSKNIWIISKLPVRGGGLAPRLPGEG
jgi:hypothetical protein